jgi:hypothetical protein
MIYERIPKPPEHPERDIIIEATQVFKAEDHPLLRAIVDKDKMYYRVIYATNPFDSSKWIGALTTLENEPILSEGDWIVKYSDGSIGYENKDYFLYNYKKKS